MKSMIIINTLIDTANNIYFMNKRSLQDQASSQKFQGSGVVAYDLPSRTLVYVFPL